MEDKPKPEEGARSTPAGGENEPASGGSGASMQYQEPPAAAQSLPATPVETTSAFQQSGEHDEHELDLRILKDLLATFDFPSLSTSLVS